MRINQYGVLVLWILWVLPAQAEELTEAALGLCERVKACSIEQLQEEELTPEMRQMLQPMLDNMCEQVKGNMGDVPTGHALYKPALACMQSMEKLSCEVLMSPDQEPTAECQRYRTAAQQSGVAPP
ncbi:MAG: hypothetical protein AAGA91_09095 [Pseudomonadota bacterium]